jgi:hypothetical protein
LSKPWQSLKQRICFCWVAGGGGALLVRERYVRTRRLRLTLSRESYCPSSTIALSTPKDRTNDSYTIASPDPMKFASSIPVTIASPFSHANDRASCSLDDCIVYPPVLLLFSGILQDVARKLILKPCFLKYKNTKKQYH